jgi:alanine dehydrogenase
MQVQGYLHLTCIKEGVLVYTLQNTPDELEWNETVDYSLISSKYRIKEYEIEYNPEFIESVEMRVIECRNYINQLIEKL